MESQNDYLHALATVCESAQKMPTPSFLYPVPALQEGFYLSPLIKQYSQYTPTPYDLQKQNMISANIINLLQETSTPILSAYMMPISPTNSWGSNSSIEDESLVKTTPLQTYISTHTKNPILRNVDSYAQYNQFLDDTWPEKCIRRGSGVIRASLYAKIADVLKGGAHVSRFRYWVKKLGFFLIEKRQPGGELAACLAMPTTSKQSSHPKTYRPYRLVARVEDFAVIIGQYHSDEKGHSGIRKTFGMVSVFMYIIMSMGVYTYVCYIIM